MIINTMEVIRAVRNVTSFTVAGFKRRFSPASRIEPKAPTPAASVGVAHPKKIDPSTRKIRNIGGRSVRTTMRANCIMGMAASLRSIMGARLGLARQIAPM